VGNLSGFCLMVFGLTLLASVSLAVGVVVFSLIVKAAGLD